MRPNNTINDLLKFFKIPVLLFGIGFILQQAFKTMLEYNETIAVILGVCSILIMLIGFVLIFYSTMLIYRDSLRRR